MRDINTVESMRSTPILALRGLTIFPNMLLHFDVGREKSISALETAMQNKQVVFLVAQKDLRVDDPKLEDLGSVGTLSRIRQLLRLPGDNIRVMVEGVSRGRISRLLQEEPYLAGEIIEFDDAPVRISAARVEALVRQTQSLFEQYLQFVPKLGHDVVMNVAMGKEPGYLADYIAQNINIKQETRQSVLEEINPVRRIRLMISILTREKEVLELERDIYSKVKDQIDKNQKEYYLREQIKVLQGELGEKEDTASEADNYLTRINALGLEEETAEKLRKEAQRLIHLGYNSAEAGIVRTYLDTCLELPWDKSTKDRSDLRAAERILDADHYGLDKVKQRILEFLAVKRLYKGKNSQVLCLVGPPGVGKTSVGMSVARALGRKISRVSLGGVRDEADIRGHRKTYIGAMPGRIMTALSQAGSKNCILLLDEIDKMSSDFRGDPSAAMLEVLDAEQNHAFRDHYLEIPFDLTEVLFITTANTTDTIPRALLDRMEVIELTSYTDEEKVRIARGNLVPKQMKLHGLEKGTFSIAPQALREIISGYTREAGVRNLERELATIMRKSAKMLVDDPGKKIGVTPKNLHEFLGVRRFTRDQVMKINEIGVANGLAWTSVGGEMLEVEVNLLDGSGKLELTGNLGDVMKESARAAISYIRSRAKELQIDPDFHKKTDIHIHFPEGAIPKDGPSAGITVTIALISALTGAPVRKDVAMTGEITLRGRVLAIGGLKEKTMAAYRAGIKSVIIPAENEKDLEEIDKTVRKALKFLPIGHADAALETALEWERRIPFTASKSEEKLPDIPADATPIKPEQKVTS